MSRGLGRLQRGIMEYLKRSSAPVDTPKLLTEGLGQELPIDSATHKAVLRAAATLIKRGLICGGYLGGRFGVHGYWLPEMRVAEVRRKMPLSLVMNGVLNSLADSNRSYAAVARDILHHAGAHPHVRTAISRAVKKLETEGKLRRFLAPDRTPMLIRVEEKQPSFSLQHLVAGRSLTAGKGRA